VTNPVASKQQQHTELATSVILLAPMSQPCFSGAREGHDDAPFSDSRLCPVNADKGKRRRKLESSFLGFSSSSPAVVEVAANGPSGSTRFRLKFLLKITVFLAVLHLAMMMRVNRKRREE
ncbi:unnamed protein product, partial [Ectocarpus sp. 12 AP-2014]